MTNTPTGTITTDGDRATIRFDRRLPYPIETVWSALTERDQLSQWFSAGFIEGRQGGAVHLADPKNIPVDGADGTDTLLTFTHSGLRIGDAQGYVPACMRSSTA